jgi:hypothetical protein
MYSSSVLKLEGTDGGSVSLEQPKFEEMEINAKYGSIRISQKDYILKSLSFSIWRF